MSELKTNDSADKTTRATKKTKLGINALFGIIMIVVYVGMGVALLCDAFPWMSGDWAWLRWTAGIVLIIYGIYRAWRQYKGIDSPYN